MSAVAPTWWTRVRELRAEGKSLLEIAHIVGKDHTTVLHAVDDGSRVTGWTAERIDRLKVLHAKGYSAGAIAADMKHVSRSAVIGKISRLGLSGRGQPTTTINRGRPRTVSETRADNRVKMRMKRPPREMRANEPGAPGGTPRYSEVPRPAPVAVKPVRFLDRRMGHECCAILNDGTPTDELLCCGNPIEEGSAFQFCPACKERFMAAPQPRRMAA